MSDDKQDRRFVCPEKTQENYLVPYRVKVL